MARSKEDRSMEDSNQLHEIDKIIADRKEADAKKATAAADEKRERLEFAARVKNAFISTQETLRTEIKKANDAIKRGGRTEEFRYQPTEQPGNGNLLSANLTLGDAAVVLRDYLIVVDATEGKIVVRGHGVTQQHTLTNVLRVKGEDWSKFLSGIYASNMR
jgi:hypothetical protein